MSRPLPPLLCPPLEFTCLFPHSACYSRWRPLISTQRGVTKSTQDWMSPTWTPISCGTKLSSQTAQDSSLISGRHCSSPRVLFEPHWLNWSTFSGILPQRCRLRRYDVTLKICAQKLRVWHTDGISMPSQHGNSAQQPIRSIPHDVACTASALRALPPCYPCALELLMLSSLSILLWS